MNAASFRRRRYDFQKELSWHRDDFEKRFADDDDDYTKLRQPGWSRDRRTGEAPNYKLFHKHVTNVLDHPLDVGQQYWQPNGISFFGLSY